MLTGKVKWFDSQKRFGYIAPDEFGYVVFVHAKDIEGGTLRENEKVTYEVRQGQKGIYAESVTLLAK